MSSSPNTNQCNTAHHDWDEIVNGTPPEPQFEDGQVYRATVYDVTIEESKRIPGTTYPRIKLVVHDGKGGRKPISWIPWEPSEIDPAARAINPDYADRTTHSDLKGCECCARVSLKRGVTAKRIFPKNYLPGPTLEEQQT